MKHQDIIAKMSLEEKAAFLSGKNVWETRDFKRLDIPSIFCSDGPHGIRKQAGAGDHLGLNASLQATCFPTAAGIANSWNEGLGEDIGRALGEEALAQQVNVLLGPGLNIKRSPLCGRNFEYFSEDPYLAGKMAAAYIKGIQSQGVYACPKHFAVNSQELRRMAMNSIVDQRTLREIYLTGFEIAVKEGGAKAIMSSYNEVNGEYANENKHLLLDILREEWGFDGIVMTDWGGSNDHAKGVAARSNLEMPSPGLDSARELISAIENKTLTMEELDICVDDLLEAVLSLNQQINDQKHPINEKEHHALAKRAASESAVLLKNEAGILPLKQHTKVVLIGDFAIEPRYQGAGSSVVNPTNLDTMVSMIPKDDVEVIGSAKGYSRVSAADENLKKEALELAAKADIVLYCFGLDELSESEGSDRNCMKVPNVQIELLDELVKVNPYIVGLISAGASVEMPWQGKLKAILHGYLSGQAGAGALWDLLTGRANPSGKLNETYPIRYEDTPAYRHFPSTERNAQYRESIYVGYRYYDTNQVDVQYPFGYGLSYTTFAYSDLRVEDTGVTFTIENTGTMDGADIAQLYISLPKAEVFRPAKELKGFAKVFLKAKERRQVTIAFDDMTFRYWNVKTNHWEVEGGTYQIQIGINVMEIKLAGTFAVAGTVKEYPYRKEDLPAYYSGNIQNVEDKEYEKLLGRSVTDKTWSGELSKNDAICQLYYAKSGVGRLVYRILTNIKNKSEAKGKPNLNILFIYNMPFRGIAKMTGGAVSRDMVDGMVTAVNGHFWRGLGSIIRGYFANAKANKVYEKKLRE